MLNPALMSGGVAVPPLLVLFGLLAGEEIGGVVGIFLSIPTLAAARIVVLRMREDMHARPMPKRGRIRPSPAERRADRAAR